MVRLPPVMNQKSIASWLNTLSLKGHMCLFSWLYIPYIMSDKLAALEKILANQKTSGNLIMKEYQDRQRQAEAKVASNMKCKYYTTQMVSSETIDLLKQNFCQIPSHRLFVACKVMNKSFFSYKTL